MKVAILGVSGIGSFLVREVGECFTKKMLDQENITFTIFDPEIVERDDYITQNYDPDNIGERKVNVLWNAFPEDHRRALNRKKKLPAYTTSFNGFDLIVLCIENENLERYALSYVLRDKEVRGFIKASNGITDSLYDAKLSAISTCKRILDYYGQRLSDLENPIRPEETGNDGRGIEAGS